MRVKHCMLWFFLLGVLRFLNIFYTSHTCMYLCMYVCIVCLFAAHESKKPVQVAYIPGHLYHMLFELMKVRHRFRPCLAAGTVHCSNAVH